MLIRKINVAIIAGIIACISSFPVTAKNPEGDSKTAVKVVAENKPKAATIAAEPGRTEQAEAASVGRRASSEPLFKLFSLEGILSMAMTIMFFLVLIKGKILKVD